MMINCKNGVPRKEVEILEREGMEVLMFGAIYRVSQNDHNLQEH